ncbi:DUF1674 domain-containing protein [Diaporthe amygdali]|uniref:DUF1674 domain-containing protein n=1 Tax=Phomopsis amygdali TaxID=1214568 RepID=UPI0022FE089F|nr:DUF1674 domain-containing protein [Diaporthe amygdali]KAJ0125303.1 DUF1674 domain-containing protein [Diaporthe amygdali]
MPSIRLFPRSSSLRAIRTAALTKPAAAAPRPSTRPSQSPLAAAAAAARPYSSAFQQGPSPPRLPAEQQAEFERLQRAVADRLADPTPLPHELPQTSPASTPGGGGAEAAAATATSTTTSSSSSTPPPPRAEEPTTGGVWRGAPPEFDGDRNPKTGEVGGPKTEPLRWGSAGDWSYNGRVTDF